jgi:hypothetical protein
MLIVIRIERSSAEKVYIGTDVNHQKRIMHCFIYLSLSFVYIYFVVWVSFVFSNVKFTFQKAFTMRENVESSQMEKTATRLFDDY